MALGKRTGGKRGKTFHVTIAQVRNKGYGKSMSSPHELPPGGLTKSPAYKLVASRCGCGAKLPEAKNRAGAPLSGGFPLKKWPVNVIVDGERACWLPDDWGQGVKNTGPGGTYIVWMSPEGRIFYHRPVIERELGRELSAKDGFNGILRSVQLHLPPKADEQFFKEVLSAKERKHIVPADQFHFAVVSARRAGTLEGTHDIMVVEAHFRHMGVKPTWYVDAASVEDYKRLGLDAIVGGKLTPARNLALEHAAKKGKVCVQVSDDISRWEYISCKKIAHKGDFVKANAMVAKAKKYNVSPVGAAQFLLAKMRAAEGASPQLGGVHPNANAAQAIGQDEISTQHFILGDFFVVDKSPCRFDPAMTLKEDYDFSCSHLDRHGSVIRCNRLFLHVKHSTNSGGAVATRDSGGSEERKNIAILMAKWPGAFMMNGRRKDEVVMTWRRRQTEDAPAQKKAAAAGAGARTSAGGSLLALKAKAGGFQPKAIVTYTGKASKAYITARCQRLTGKTVEECLTAVSYKDKDGKTKRYGLSDLRYDLARGLILVSGQPLKQGAKSPGKAKVGGARHVKLGLRAKAAGA